MATSTRSSSTRARASSSRSATKTQSTRATPTKRYPKGKQPVFQDDRPGPLSSAWLGLAHLVGGAARVFGKETLAKEERRDGFPLFLVVLAVAGAVVEWFNPSSDIAQALDAYTFGGLLGRVAFGLPVIMLIFAVWLFRHPSSVHDNTRVGIGLALLLACVSAFCHVFSDHPQPSQGLPSLAHAGGVVGWVIGQPFVAIGAAWLAVPIVGAVGILSLFIISKTPPNRTGERLRELYAYLFGAELAERPAKATAAAEEEPELGSLTDLGLEMDDPSTMPWWRRGKKSNEPAFDSALEHPTEVTEVIAHTPVHDDAEILAELANAEEAVRRFTGEAPAVAPTSLREDGPVALFDAGDDLPLPAAAPAPAASKRPYRLPTTSLLEAGDPPKTKTPANVEAIASITSVLTQFGVDARSPASRAARR